MSESREGLLILGFPRSGTTFFRRILDAHSSISCPGETHLFAAVGRFLDSYQVAGGVAVGVENGLALAGFTSAELAAKLRELVFSFHREHLRRTGKRLWAEKTALDVFHLDKIEKVFGGHLRFLCLHRHPLDVIVSVKEWCDRCEAYPPELHEYIRRSLHPYEAIARAWVDVSRRQMAFETSNSPQVLSLRYENLLCQPEDELRRVFDWIGVSWEDGLIERATEKEPDGFGDWKAYRGKGADVGSIGRWKDLPSSTIHELAAILNPVVEQLGYEPIPVAGPISQEESLRRYRLGLMLQQARS